MREEEGKGEASGGQSAPALRIMLQMQRHCSPWGSNVLALFKGKQIFVEKS